MSNISEIKKKINSISKLKKITNVMKIIATSKINKYKQNFLQNSDFNDILFKIIKPIIQNTHIKENTNKKTLWVIFTSSLGMSGNYNINLFKQINENVKKDDKIILFGKKGINFIKGKDIDENILFSSSISEKDFNFLWFTNLSKKVFFEYNKNNIGKISIIYTRIMPNKKIISTAEDIFPLKVGKEIDINYNFEQNIEKIYKKAIIFFIHSMFYTAFIESKFCEQIARKNAMNDANENISKTIDELKNQYNKKRQEKITNSIFKNIENE